jgi:hypothetical protein
MYDPVQPYFELHITYDPAEGHGHEDHPDDLIPMPDEGCPTPEVTPTPTATPEPTAIPIFESGLCDPQQPYTVGSGPEAPEGYEFANMYPNTEGIPPDTPLFLFVGGWLANGADCAAQNAEHVTMTFSLDGQDIPLTQGHIYNCSDAEEGGYCAFWYALIDGLPAGVHSGVEVVLVDAAFSTGYDGDNDGELDQMEPGPLWEQSYVFIVSGAESTGGGDSDGYPFITINAGAQGETCEIPDGPEGEPNPPRPGTITILHFGGDCGSTYEECTSRITDQPATITVDGTAAPVAANMEIWEGVITLANGGLDEPLSIPGGFHYRLNALWEATSGTHTISGEWTTGLGELWSGWCTVTISE